MLSSGTRFISGQSSAPKNLAGALHAEAVRSDLSFGREVKMDIPANDFSHLYLAIPQSSRMDAEREEFREAIADFDRSVSVAACRYHSVVDLPHRLRKKPTHTK
jgi:hypothetical protein